MMIILPQSMQQMMKRKKLWSGLQKSQLDEGPVNQLDVINTIFIMEEVPVLTVLDVSRRDTPSGKHIQVEPQWVLLNPRTLKQKNREQRARSGQNNNKLINVI